MPKSKTTTRRRDSSDNARFLAALNKIACMGEGLKESVIDWANVGKNAKYTAQEALYPRCAACGQALKSGEATSDG